MESGGKVFRDGEAGVVQCEEAWLAFILSPGVRQSLEFGFISQMNFAQLAHQCGTQIVGRLQLKQPDGVGVDERAVGVDFGWLNGCHTLSSVSDTRKRFRG
jgi:hypothetical protein